MPYYMKFSLDSATLLYAAAVSLVAGVLFGLAPAVQSSRGALTNALKDGARGASGGARHNRLHTVGVESQLDDRLYDAIVRIVREALTVAVREALDDLSGQAARPRFAGLSDAARWSGVSKRQIRQFVKSGALPAYAPGGCLPDAKSRGKRRGKLVVNLAELEQLIRAHAVTTGDVDLEKLADETLMELNTK